MAGLSQILRPILGIVIGGISTNDAIDYLTGIGYNYSTDFLPNSRFATVKLVSNAPTQSNQAIAGNSQRNQIAGHYWTAEVTYTNLDESTYRDIMGFVASRSVGLTDFFVILPEFSVPTGSCRSVAQDTMTVDTNRAIGSKTITVDMSVLTSADCDDAGVDPAVFLRRGDFVSFSNHSKMYQLTEDAAIDGSGNVQLKIYPGLFGVVTTSTTVNYLPSIFKFFITGNEQEYEAGVGNTRTLVLKLQESI